MTCRLDACNQPFGGKRFSFPKGPAHPQFVDMTGQRFGRLSVLAFAGIQKDAMWHVRCDCGTEKVCRGADMRAGKIVSCGCLAREKAKAAGDRTRTHGKSGTSTHNIWDSMIQRCTNPNRKDYWRYGGAGITVCQRWRESFSNFLADMGERPAGLTLDRWPNAGGNYEPGNCRWATPAEQVRNSTAARMVTINGRTQCVKDWADELGMCLGTYSSRKQRGWSAERALTTPADQRFNWRNES